MPPKRGRRTKSPRAEKRKAAENVESNTKRSKRRSLDRNDIEEGRIAEPSGQYAELSKVHEASDTGTGCVLFAGKEENTLDMFPLLWNISLSEPVHNLVSYRGCVYGRFGGEKGGIWRLYVPGEHEDPDAAADCTDEDGNPKPQIIIHGLTEPDGYGLCIDTTRDLIVFCVGNKVLRYDLEGKLVKKKAITGVKEVSAVTYCKKDDIYKIGHSAMKKFIDVDAETFKITDRDNIYRGRGPSRSIFWMTHTDEECCMTSMTKDINPCLIIRWKGGGNTETGGRGTKPDEWDTARDQCWDSLGHVIVCDAGNDRVIRRFFKKDFKEHCIRDRRTCEIIVSEQKLPGGRPTCVTLVNEKYLFVLSSETLPQKLSCFTYTTDTMDAKDYNLFK